MPGSPEKLPLDVDAILQKTAEYIGMTQPIIDGVNEQREQFAKQAKDFVGTMVERNIVKQANADKLVDKFVGDPSSLFQFTVKLADALTTEKLGEPSNIKVASGARLSGFELLAMGEDPAKALESNVTTSSNNGFVD